MLRTVVFLVFALVATGCEGWRGPNPRERDGGPIAGRRASDAGPRDSGPEADSAADSGPGDSGPVDGGPGDSGPVDGGPGDSGPVDSGPSDSGARDADIDAAPSDEPPAPPELRYYEVWPSGELAIYGKTEPSIRVSFHEFNVAECLESLNLGYGTSDGDGNFVILIRDIRAMSTTFEVKASRSERASRCAIYPHFLARPPGEPTTPPPVDPEPGRVCGGDEQGHTETGRGLGFDARAVDRGGWSNLPVQAMMRCDAPDSCSNEVYHHHASLPYGRSVTDVGACDPAGYVGLTSTLKQDLVSIECNQANTYAACVLRMHIFDPTAAEVDIDVTQTKYLKLSAAATCDEIARQRAACLNERGRQDVVVSNDGSRTYQRVVVGAALSFNLGCDGYNGGSVFECPVQSGPICAPNEQWDAATGACRCDAGYEGVFPPDVSSVPGTSRVCRPVCADDQVRNVRSMACEACPGGQIRNASGVCACADGFESVGGTCVAVCLADQVRNANGVCEADPCLQPGAMRPYSDGAIGDSINIPIQLDDDSDLQCCRSCYALQNCSYWYRAAVTAQACMIVLLGGSEISEDATCPRGTTTVSYDPNSLSEGVVGVGPCATFR
jgi:hypothetical protein